MDQDGNTAMPQTPSFSSPNIQQNNNTPSVEQPTAVPTEPANTSVAAAAAAITDADPKPMITSSAPSAPVSTSAGSHMFGRHFNKKNTVSAPTTFAGAPDFFNEAAAQNSDYITIGEQPARTSNKKRLIIIASLVGVLAIVAVVALVVAPSAQRSLAKGAALKDWNRVGNYILFDEEKDDDLPSSSLSFVDTKIVIGNEGVDSGRYQNILDKLGKYDESVTDESIRKEISSDLDDLKTYFGDLMVLYIVREMNESNFIDYAKTSYASDDARWSTIMEDISAENLGLDGTFDTIRDYMDAKIDLYKAYADAGCLVDNSLDESCVGDYVNTVDGNQRFIEARRAGQVFASDTNQYYIDIVSGIMGIRDTLSGKNEGNK